ncbi:unnamed protein product [Arctia plantaginis]|uniref:Macro domain-containing protein n=1 Tax=Arctia plantaginis TaxID=874455 RepID=A0A8S1BQS5_ARCPL|nr:unnamed protein product [Arctia plantaginis]
MTIIEPGVCVMRAPGSVGVGAAGVPRWAHSAPAPHTDYARHIAPLHPHPVFLHDDQINNRIAIWQGDISTLEVDAIANTTDETLTECNSVNERILQVAGPELKEEIITRGYECRTGDVVVTPGFGLRCRHIIHTVSPKYVAKYHTAAETSLHNCYRNVVCKAQELGARSLALCALSAPHRNFPPDLAAHVALRTVRRHLEQQRLPALVVVAAARGAEAALLVALAPLYFPRDAHEADAQRWRLPLEPAYHDRRIRIIHNPHEHSSDTDKFLCSTQKSGIALLDIKIVFQYLYTYNVIFHIIGSTDSNVDNGR